MEFDDCWASLFLASSPPPRGLSVSSCSYGRGFAYRFFQFHLTATPCGSATVTVIGSGKHLPACKTTHMLGTLGAGFIPPSLFRDTKRMSQLIGRRPKQYSQADRLMRMMRIL